MRALLVLFLGLLAFSCGEAEPPARCDTDENCHETEQCSADPDAVGGICKLRNGQQCLRHQECLSSFCEEGYCAR